MTVPRREIFFVTIDYFKSIQQVIATARLAVNVVYNKFGQSH
jgi:hypothetical protein